MSRSDSGPTYYHATALPHAERPALRGEHRADVCVIGAGFTGLSAALELAGRGFSVVVLEAESIGWGASGRNGGQICTGFSSGMAKIEAQLGPADAKLCFAVAEEGKAMIRENIARHGIACDLKWGYVHVAPKERDVAHLAAMQESLASYGVTDAELLDKQALEEKFGTTLYYGGLREAGAGHFHPLNYCLGVAAAAERAGVEIFERSRVISVEGGSAPCVRTDEGTVRARFVLAAGNAYLGPLIKPLHARIMPVGSFVVTTEPLGENQARALIRDDEAVADTNFILDYFRLTGDRRMLFGGRCSYTGVIPRDVTRVMRPRLLRVFPQLSDARIEHGWGGFIGITMNRILDVGRIEETIYYAQGYSGQGVVLGTACGRLIAEAIAGQAGRFDVMARVKHGAFPGGPLRAPLLALAMLWYRLRDALG